ncbi:hypothetical protein [Bartonella grahamii]|uniref:Uncharacterized protein n=2 Tax=Bartonella grahamii TaxID=33045 RepID=A0A336NDQ6_BARGR|nr:hypothetical protein [Bartonella grahamii]ACS50826.1 hypothetical protein Bgr_05050 [Bartonella grahamii as4aup]SSZ40372.1 Uncharacterised protein [Bartonella grahamii]
MLFSEEDNCSAGAHSQAEGAGGLIGEVIGGALAGAGDALADKYNECHPNPSCEVSDYVESAAIKGGAGALIGLLGGPEAVVAGGLGGVISGFKDKYKQCHP